MTTIRMIAIALPMMLLMACGGGGGSSTAAAPTTTPPTGDGNGGPTGPQDLPEFLIEASTARGYFSGSTAPSTMASDAIEGIFRARAQATGAEVLFEDIVEIGGSARTASCTGTTCTGTLSDNTALEYSFSEFGNTPEINSQTLLGFNDDYSLVMTYRGVTLAQGRVAGRGGSTGYEFLNYGGWLTNSAFGVQHETADGSGNNDISYLTAYSFGVPSGSNPTVSGVANWVGIMVGVNQSEEFIQGSFRMTIASDAPNVITNLTFGELTNLNTGVARGNDISWKSVSVTNGAFSTVDGSVKGTFYGTGHTEAGGTFNHDGITGAFGGVR